MEYSIVRAGNYAVLVNSVNDAISEGWRPIGGVSIEEDISGSLNKFNDEYEGDVSSSSYFYQALIRE